MQYGREPGDLHGLKAALDFNREICIDRITGWNHAMATQLVQGLREIFEAWARALAGSIVVGVVIVGCTAAVVFRW